MENYNKTQYEYMLEKNKNHMNEIALSFEGRKITYEELHDKIDKYARLLYKRGIRSGDRIGFSAYNTPEAVYLLYALIRLGAIDIGFNPLEQNKSSLITTKNDLENTRPKMVITVDRNYSNFKKWEKALDFSTILFSPFESSPNTPEVRKFKALYNTDLLLKGNFKLSGKNNLSSLLKEDYSDVSYPEGRYLKDSVGDIIFTGGSTGNHKGVDLAQDSFNAVVEGMNSIFPAEPGMIHLGNIPFCNMAYGRSILHFALCNNMEYALTVKAMPSDFISELERTHANAAVGGPVHWVTFIEEKDGKYVRSSRLKEGSLSELHYATSGGEAKKAATVDAINAGLKYCGSDAKLGDGLGSTETSGSTNINNGRIHHNNTIGVPISTVDVRLIKPCDPTEKASDIPKVDVKDGEEGELIVSGDTVMLGYHNNKEETDRVLYYDENGKRCIRMLDLVRLNEDKEYEYVGRLKRTFVSGCDNIYSEKLEETLMTIPEIKEVVVTPISDPMVQHVPRYHISLAHSDIDITELEKKIETVVLSKHNINWLPGNIVYYDKPLERMSNSKINIGYYKNIDTKDFEEGKIDISKAKELRLKMI